MKKIIIIVVVILAICLVIGMVSGNDGSGDQGIGDASGDLTSTLGDYEVVIESCRLATDYEGKPVAIVKYKFSNNGDEPAAFLWSLEDAAFQDGVGLNKSYVLDKSANYSSDNQTKEIKKGASLYVEVAYELNDTTTDIEIEVSEFISCSDKKITKTFKIN